jgi:hypothetical protein
LPNTFLQSKQDDDSIIIIIIIIIQFKSSLKYETSRSFSSLEEYAYFEKYFQVFLIQARLISFEKIILTKSESQLTRPFISGFLVEFVSKTL